MLVMTSYNSDDMFYIQKKR